MNEILKIRTVYELEDAIRSTLLKLEHIYQRKVLFEKIHHKEPSLIRIVWGELICYMPIGFKYHTFKTIVIDRKLMQDEI